MTQAIVAEILKYVVVTALSFLVGVVTNITLKQKKKKEKCSSEIDCLKDGLSSVLRMNILSVHDKYTSMGYCPVFIKDAITKSYLSYHNLGGNGVATKLYNDIMSLPESEDK